MYLSSGGYHSPITPRGGYWFRPSPAILAWMVAISQPSTDPTGAPSPKQRGLLVPLKASYHRLGGEVTSNKDNSIPRKRANPEHWKGRNPRDRKSKYETRFRQPPVALKRPRSPRIFTDTRPNTRGKRGIGRTKGSRKRSDARQKVGAWAQKGKLSCYARFCGLDPLLIYPGARIPHDRDDGWRW